MIVQAKDPTFSYQPDYCKCKNTLCHTFIASNKFIFVLSNKTYILLAPFKLC